MSSNYPPGAEAELNRRAAADEAWEAYADKHFDAALDGMAADLAEYARYSNEVLATGDIPEFIRHIKAWGGWNVKVVLVAAAEMGLIPDFDSWCVREDDPDRRRDEREDR